ncbi:hypothetical protein OIU76_002696 [Salix suchowensis]|nr:hypothetical protein OIU76_002696 [Salix suchowensis]
MCRDQETRVSFHIPSELYNDKASNTRCQIIILSYSRQKDTLLSMTSEMHAPKFFSPFWSSWYNLANNRLSGARLLTAQIIKYTAKRSESIPQSEY